MIPVPIKFWGDESNLNYKSFQVTEAGKRVKYLATDSNFRIFNHAEPLAASGVFYFKLRVLQTANTVIMLGICSTNIKSKINAYIDK